MRKVFRTYIMKKWIVAAAMAWVGGTFVHAQDSSLVEVEQLEAINWQLDSLMPCYKHEDFPAADFDRNALNIFGFAEDSVPTYDQAALSQRLEEMGTVIPMGYNSYVHAYINLYTQRRREQVERMMGLAYLYFPIFEAELDRQGMPMELKYLPVVESALNPHARSRVGATGLWQFMLATGKMYGLKVTSYLDERKDPYKATEAAVRYLKNMYKTYGDWLLVIAAYNCGPGNVNKAISRSGGKRNFWEIRENLPRETRGYVPAFIAASYAFTYATEHNLYPRKIDFTFDQDTIQVTGQKFHLKHLAEVTGSDLYVLKDLNPELQRDILPKSSKPYTLRVPMETGQFYAAKRDSLLGVLAHMNPDTVKQLYAVHKVSPLTNKPYKAAKGSVASSTAGKNMVYHKVRSGETVSQIAERYNVGWKSVQRWNGLRGYRIKPGQRLKIYTSGKGKVSSKTNTVASTTKPKPKANSGTKYYTVRNGDTLWDIANAEGTTVSNIKSLNDMRNSRLSVGQRLRVN